MIYVLDTDHLTHLAWGQSAQGRKLLERLSHLTPEDEAATTIVNYEEQMRGWLGVLASARTLKAQVEAYSRLQMHLDNLRRIPILGFDEVAATQFSRLQKLKLGVGSMDLRIASITLANRATLLTCNMRDFRLVPDLVVEDWTR
jgi:tRNA(fMet)-specific endonuclease VapC